MKKLFLASTSKSRSKLLKTLGLEFSTIKPTLDEETIPLSQFNNNLEDAVKFITEKKAESAIEIVNEKLREGETGFILTGDTLGFNPANNQFLSKPTNEEDAARMLASYTEPVKVSSGSCLMQMLNGKMISKEIFCETSEVEFYIPQKDIKSYLKSIERFTEMSGAVEIDNPASWQFCKSIKGSYTAILGLPIFEVRERLTKHGLTKP